MKMRDIFEIEDVDGKRYMVCLDNNVLAGMVELNETAAFIVDNLMEDTTVELMAKKMCEVYEVTHDEALEGVNIIVEQLRQINAIEE